MAPFLKGFIFCLLLLWPGLLWPQNLPDAQKFKADGLQDQATQAIDDGDMHKGLELMAQAVSLDPAPARRMNYGGMLYGDGMEILENIDQKQGLDILQKAQSQLQQAIAAFDPERDRPYLSQCYYLLGKIYVDGFADQPKAKEYFKRAADLGDYTDAKEILNKLAQ